MKRSEVLQEARKMRFEEAYNQYRSSRLSCEDAADLLGTSVSTFYHYRRRFEGEGVEGLADRRIGKLSARRAPVDEVLKVVTLFEIKYYDFSVKHIHKKLPGHGINRSYTWTKKVLQEAGKVKKAPRLGAHRRKRLRLQIPEDKHRYHYVRQG